MSEMINFFSADPAPAAKATVEFFDPPMCCPTGICGPTIDEGLLDVSDMIQELLHAGVHIARYQMTTNPQAFLSNADVMRLVREQELAALPITIVNGRVIKTGAYPTLAEMKSALNGALS